MYDQAVMTGICMTIYMCTYMFVRTLTLDVSFDDSKVSGRSTQVHDSENSHVKSQSSSIFFKFNRAFVLVITKDLAGWNRYTYQSVQAYFMYRHHVELGHIDMWQG